MKRIKTDYPGVYYREIQRVGRKGFEKVYYVTFKRDGKKVEAKVGGQYRDDMTPSRAAVLRADYIERKQLTRKEKREVVKEEKGKVTWTIGKLWDSYKETRTSNKSLQTDKSRYILYIKPTLENKTPAEIILLDIDRLKHGNLKSKSPQTVKHVLSLLERVVRHGVKRGLCDHLPFFIEKPRVNNITTEDLNPRQMAMLLKTIDEDTHPQAGPIMLMALFTGMRRGEMLKLKWKDVDFDRGFIRIMQPKGGIDQTIPLNNAARDLLKTHHKTGSEYIFPGRAGNQRTDINKAVNDIKKKANLPKDFRPLHGLRHTYASMLASSGKVDMYVLQKLLTHKDSRMTQRYEHLRDDALRKASDLAGSIIEQAVNGKGKVVKLED